MTAVITGIGVVSAFGAGATRFWDGICSGVSAVRAIESFDASTFPVTVAAEVPGNIVADCPVSVHQRDRKVVFALRAAEQALQQAGITGLRGAIELSLGLGLETALLDDFTLLSNGDIDWPAAASRAGTSTPRLRTPADLAAQQLVGELGIGGVHFLHMSACAAGAAAVACAASLIARGWSSMVLCGGTDSMINPLGLGGMARLGATSPRATADACRPFDLHRDGLTMGEGAAMFVVESEASALARGAPVLAKITGWGSTQDAYKATAPRPDGSAAVAAMQRALHRARLEPGQIDYINAHGTGTPLNDVTEALAIRQVFGAAADTLPVSSIKGAIGHAMAAAGALELAACALALAAQRVPGTTNLQTFDPACPISVVPPGVRDTPLRRVMSNSFGFGGHNAVVVLEAP